jgi:hypothetical protein
MVFNVNKCKIPTVYCGNGEPKIPKESDNIKYSGIGTPYQCMQKGFGAGSVTERLKTLPASSLQNIKFIGESYETNFQNSYFQGRVLNIRTIRDLNDWVSHHTPAQTEQMLREVLQKKNGVFDVKAYNSTLFHLYKNVNAQIPDCIEL